MPRLPRVKVEGAIYYVTSKPSQNQVIFKDKADYQMYLDLLAKYKKDFGFKLYSYNLQPEKAHLLIEVGQSATISQIMHALNSLYTKYFNGRYSQKGHLFESRFKSVLVEKAQYLLEMTRFVHRAVGPAYAEYPYTSFYIYRLVESGQDTTDFKDAVREALDFMKNNSISGSYETYCASLDDEGLKNIEKKLRRGGVLGSDRFHASVMNRIEEHTEEIRSKTQAKPNRAVIVLAGAVALVAFPTAVFFYISKSSIETKYERLLKAKELEFKEGARFENQSPIALTQLDGTRWNIEFVSLPAVSATEATRDEIWFERGRFYSKYLESLGFHGGTYFMVTGNDGVVNWQTALSNAKGETVSVSGQWRGDAIRGSVKISSQKQVPVKDYSFYSTSWRYAQHG